MEPSVSIVGGVLKKGFATIKRGFGYVMSSESFAADLRKEVRYLDNEAGRVGCLERGARNNVRNLRDEFQTWKASADEALKEALDLLDDFDGASKTCCYGTLPDPCFRYQFSSKAEALIEGVRERAAQSINLFKELDDISCINPAPGIGATAPNPARREGKDVISPTKSTATAPPRVERGLNPVSDLLRWAVTAIKYVISSEIYAQDLQKEVGKLACEFDWVDFAVEQAKQSQQTVSKLVLPWCADADEALKEARSLLHKFEKASKTWCCGNLPDLRCHYEFSTKAKDKIKAIQQLAQESTRFKEWVDISYGGPPSGYVKTPTLARKEGKDVVQSTPATASASSASTSVEPREDGLLESRALMRRNIVDALADDNNSVVGVYGMGGVGKSTLLVDAERRIREQMWFDWVAKADVSKNPDIKRIQGEIAHWLGLTDIKKEENVSLRAELLRRRLEYEEREKKKVLIILDNLWEGVDLKSVGIPCGHDNKVKGCKLLLTSRDSNVLQMEMGCDKAFRLEGLEEKEARALFETIVGDQAHTDEFKPLVDEVLRRCAGVPFLIVAMAKRFKNAKLFEWKDALRNMEKFKDEHFNELTDYVCRWSYDNLGEEEKSFLQICVVYGGSEPSLENLLKYGVSLGIFREDSSVEEARDKWRSLIRSLQDASLLLDSEEADRFKIHDLVWAFVFSVASSDRRLHGLNDKDKSVTGCLGA